MLSPINTLFLYFFFALVLFLLIAGALHQCLFLLLWILESAAPVGLWYIGFILINVIKDIEIRNRMEEGGLPKGWTVLNVQMQCKSQSIQKAGKLEGKDRPVFSHLTVK